MPGAARISCRPLSSQRKGSAKRSRCSVTGCAAGGGGAGGSAGGAPAGGGGGGGVGAAGRGGGGGRWGGGCRWIGGRLRSRVGRCGGHAGRRSMVWRMGWRETDACTVSQPQPLRHRGNYHPGPEPLRG